ncbi:MAG: DUF1801 domain-containing protein [Pyrinomonadaceae bacterium]
MPKHKPKTRETDASVDDFLRSVDDDTRRSDAYRVLEIFERATGETPKMWGTAIVGFGSCPIKYADGRSLDWPIAAFSPRKQNLTLYVISSSPRQPELLARLGRHTKSKACLYIKRLADVDEAVLEHLVRDSYEFVKNKTAGSCGL